MRNNELEQSMADSLFSGDTSLKLDYRQVSKFIYDQLTDGFVFFGSDEPVDWRSPKSTIAQFKILSEGFRICEINEAFSRQFNKSAEELMGITLGELFGKYFKKSANDWHTLINKGEVSAEFTLEKSPDIALWVEAHYRLIRDEKGRTVGIIAVQRDIAKQQTAFRVYEEAEEKLKKLAYLSFQAIVLIQDGQIADFNEALVKLTQYNRNELMNSNVLYSCLPPKISKDLFIKRWSKPVGPFETTLLRKDSTPVTVEIDTQIITHNDNHSYVVGIHDITKRKKIEDEIIKLSIALDQSANVITITHKNGEIEYVNRSFTTVTGYSQSEVIGKNPRILKSGTHPPSFYKSLWKTLLKGKQWKGEFHNRKKNGELYWESATITPVKNRDGEIVRFIAIKEDITLRKKAEQSLRESEEKFRSMVSNIPGVVYRCAFDKSWSVYYITDAVETLTGYKASDFQNNSIKAFSSIIHPDDMERVMESISTGIADFQQFNIEFRIITKLKTVKWVSNSGRPVYHEDKTIKWLDGFLLDITERIMAIDEFKKAKIAAEEANNAKSEFLANISHEIRTPLNSVLGFTELLEGLTTDSVQIKYLDSIRASGKNLMMLINDLLDLSKIESGKMTLHYTFFDIRRLLDEIRNVFSLRVTVKGIGYVEKLDKDFPAEIYFDEIRLRQILINLVGNAVKFTHKGGIQIIVKATNLVSNAESSKMKLEIRVKDTGIGIPESSFRLIFESFRQHSQLDSRKYEGTGLGLAITKRLVEAMNGTINLESEVGKGSVFKVEFTHVEYSKVSSNAISDVILPHNNKLADHEQGNGNTALRHENYILDGQVDLNQIKGSDFYLLVKRFEQELTTRWKMFEKKQPLREIQSFAQEIVTLGKSFKIGFLTQYGEQLLSTIENFDVEAMRLKLDYFPDLIRQLKKLGHEKK